MVTRIMKPLDELDENFEHYMELVKPGAFGAGAVHGPLVDNVFEEARRRQVQEAIADQTGWKMPTKPLTICGTAIGTPGSSQYQPYRDAINEARDPVPVNEASKDGAFAQELRGVKFDAKAGTPIDYEERQRLAVTRWMGVCPVGGISDHVRSAWTAVSAALTKLFERSLRHEERLAGMQRAIDSGDARLEKVIANAEIVRQGTLDQLNAVGLKVSVLYGSVDKIARDFRSGAYSGGSVQVLPHMVAEIKAIHLGGARNSHSNPLRQGQLYSLRVREVTGIGERGPDGLFNIEVTQ